MDARTASDEVLEQFPLALLTLVRTAQAQNGVKHGDYPRYRQHCTNKLRTLYKVLKFQHGRTKYIKRTIDHSTVTDVRFLHITLFSAERAWAYAMEMKKKIEGNPDAQMKRHLVTRMRKAAAWSRDLARLAAVRADVRGALEAEAYSAWLAGVALVEGGGHWARALALLGRAKHVFTALSGLGADAEAQVLCAQQVEDMEPVIRYCQYQLSRQGGVAPSEEQLAALLEQEQAAGGVERPSEAVLASQLAQLATVSVGRQPEEVVELEWLGQQLPVRQERLKAAVGQVKALAAEVDGAMDVDSAPLEQRLAACDRLLRAVAAARTVATTAGKAAATGQEADAQLPEVEVALEGWAAQRSAQRAALVAADAEARFALGVEKAALAAGGVVAKKGGKDRGSGNAPRPDDVVRSLDIWSRALAELADVGARSGGRRGEQLYNTAQAQMACAKASRAYHTAHAALAGGRALEAAALFGRTTERAEAAKLGVTAGSPDGARMEQLASHAHALKLVAHAEVAATRAGEREGVEAGVGSLGLAEGPQSSQGGTTKYLLDAPDACESFAAGPGGVKGAPRVFRLPYAMQALPCRPIMLDTASDHLAYPNLEHRVRKTEKKSVLSSLTGWAWGKK